MSGLSTYEEMEQMVKKLIKEGKLDLKRFKPVSPELLEYFGLDQVSNKGSVCDVCGYVSE